MSTSTNSLYWTQPLIRLSLSPLISVSSSQSTPIFGLVKLFAGTVIGYLKMRPNLWQFWSRLVGVGFQCDTHDGEKGSSIYTDTVSLSDFIYYTVKTFIRESLILPSLFHCSNTEPWRKMPSFLPKREWSHLQTDGLGLLGFGVSHWGLSLAQTSRSRSWAAIRDKHRMFPAGGLNTSESKWRFPWQW